YGLYGVILDVTLRVTRDELYEQRAVTMDYTEFPAYFAQHIHADSSVALLLVRPSIDPAPDSFLRELVVVTWRRTGSGHAATFDLTEEEHVWRDRFFLGLSRRFDWAKSLRWKLQKKIELGSGETRIVSRNNAMRPPVAPLEYGGTDYLTYQLYPTPQQLHRAYPNARHAFDRKRFYDPGELFTSQFYERYGHTEPR